VMGGAVVAALALTGYVSARLGGSSPARAVARLVLGGILAMAITYLIGGLFDAQIS
jgi:VIT1/CCC1 family predicted Fe2+/Mn2+ transporter